ncbi:hypothetical protein GJ744_006515 [Endocarpon pusillum]|uniref:ubiquitinyl hydrolase 1 n=1 Tax=Endocarpon pusillum TaxID=364733 RepID=A0A8H7AVG6_9EURO|nr:hypothetical protein GJ744_006515 [Endocarpon pusillum]
MPQVPALAGILLNWPTIAGYDRSFDRFLLSDLIDVRFALEWGPLVNLCRASHSKEKYQPMFLFAVISFREDAEMDVIRTLIAFAVFEGLQALDPPKWQSYSHFRPNHIPSVGDLVPLVKHCCVPYHDDERRVFQGSLGSKMRRKLEAAERAHEQQTETDCNYFAQFLLAQWPCPEPVIEGFLQPLLLDVPRAFKIISSEYLRLYQNMELSQYIAQVQPILDLHCTGSKIELPISGFVDQDVILTRQRGGEFATLSQNLLQKTGPTMSGKLQSMVSNVGRWNLGGENGEHVGFASQKENDPNATQKENFRDRFREPTKTKCTVSPVTHEIQELECIINGILDSESTIQQQYGRDMKQSLEALKDLGSAPKQAEETIIPQTLPRKILMAKEQVQDSLRQLSMAFEHQCSCAQWLKEGGLWPCITPVTLLEQLRSTSGTDFGCGMKESLIVYAISLTVLQRLLRIEDAHLRGDKQRLHEELMNPGHGNWKPLENPDWLLLEIDGNILIRHDQVEVADATIAPTSGSNAVLQMNMGQGKTSCIIPMVAAMLADTKQLMRVIVPKSLLLKTAQLLQARLGGLLGREVRHVPFSRKTPTSSETIKAFFNLHKQVMASSGVIVALPEHILSFMLSGIQRLSDVRMAEATQMVKVQAWIRQSSRDVLDESDFTLAVRTQLIYPSGSQMTVDGHPHRWWVAETLLRLIDGHLWNLQQDLPRSIEVVRRSQGGFPHVFFLSKDVEDELIARLVKDVLRGLVSIIPIRECRPSDRVAIKHFISDANIRPAFAEHIRGIFPDKRAARQAIYLLRGLLVHRILLLTLKKRWNVQYGLQPSRDPIAVPFHAKGVPSEQAEWGHPDVAILFTCLAFYYGGLKFAQLRQSLEHLLKSDDPSSEYDRWNHSSKTLPDPLREWNVINVDDEAQLMEIWQHLRYEVVVIDYFLNHFVFPKLAKQFRMKLQASGWDIPLSSNATQIIKKYPKSLTTGFSGTNDNRFLLPLTIKQADLCALSHTNAEVLTYLLQPRSRGYVLAADIRGRAHR